MIGYYLKKKIDREYRMCGGEAKSACKLLIRKLFENDWLGGKVKEKVKLSLCALWRHKEE